ncbi:MAG: tetratricopeptide repeat protein [Bacteriovoracaceae bacterium]
MKAFLTFTLTLMLFSVCIGSAMAQKIDIKSNPEEAEIVIYSDESSPPQKLGKTPYTANLKDLITTYVKKNNFIIELRKEGFEPYKVLFTKTTNLDVELAVSLEISRTVKTIKKHDMLVTELFDVQKLIRGKNFGDAIKKLDLLEKDNPQFSVIAELKATTYYMMKDMENALSYYRKAFSINSDNVDSYKMKVYLEKIMKIDTEIKK